LPLDIKTSAKADAIGRALAVWPLLAAGDTERAMLELHTRPASGRPPGPDGEGKPRA